MKGGLTAAQHRHMFENAEVQEEQIVIKCVICHRTRPIFGGTDEIKRLPESALNPFLKKLRDDTVKKAKYLQ